MIGITAILAFAGLFTADDPAAVPQDSLLEGTTVRRIPPEKGGVVTHEITLVLAGKMAIKAVTDNTVQILLFPVKAGKPLLDRPVRLANTKVVSPFAADKGGLYSLTVTADQISNGIKYLVGVTWSGTLETSAVTNKTYYHSKVFIVSGEDLWSSKHFYVSAGVIALSPYHISESTDSNGGKLFTIESSGTADTAFEMDVVFRNRAAWSGYHLAGWLPDFEVRIGFANSSQDLSAVSIAGTGQFSGELSMGWDLPYGFWDTQLFYPDFNFSFDMEMYAGFATDSLSLGVHGTIGVGPALIFAIPAGTDENGDKRSCEIMLGLFFGASDAPHLEDGLLTLHNSRKEHPAYKVYPAMIGRYELRIPIGNSGYLVLNGLFADEMGVKHDVIPWTVSIGMTLPLDKVLDLVKAPFQ